MDFCESGLFFQLVVCALGSCYRGEDFLFNSLFSAGILHSFSTNKVVKVLSHFVLRVLLVLYMRRVCRPPVVLSF